MTEVNEKLAKAIGVWIRMGFPPLLGNLWANVTFYISRLSNNNGGCGMGLLTRLHNTLTPMTPCDKIQLVSRLESLGQRPYLCQGRKYLMQRELL